MNIFSCNSLIYIISLYTIFLFVHTNFYNQIFIYKWNEFLYAFFIITLSEIPLTAALILQFSRHLVNREQSLRVTLAPHLAATTPGNEVPAPNSMRCLLANSC